MQDKNIEELSKMYSNLNPNYLFNEKMDYKNMSYYSSPDINQQDSSPLEYTHYFSLMNDPYLNNLNDGPKNAIRSDLGKEMQVRQNYYQQGMTQEPQSMTTSVMQSSLDLETVLSWESSDSGKSHSIPIMKKKRGYTKSNLKNMNRRCESYVCDYEGCNKIFTRPYNLKAHTKIHTQERPFICSVCHISFSRLHDMKRHTSLHSGIKPYSCPHCDKAFARLGKNTINFLDALNRHIKKDKNSCSTVIRTERRKKNTIKSFKTSDIQDLTQFMDISSFDSSSSLQQY